MPDILTGTVFNVGRRNTRGLSVEDYMRSMGAVEDPDGVEFDMQEPMDEAYRPGTTEANAYENALDTLNQFGAQAAANGYDVFNPNPRNPQSQLVSREFQKLASRVQKLANSLVFEKGVIDYARKESMKPNVVGRMNLPQNRLYSDQDAQQQLYNYSPFADMINKTVQDWNKFAKEYKNQGTVDLVNQKKRGVIDKMNSMVDLMVQNGIPYDEAREMADRGIALLQDASIDALGAANTRASIAARDRSNRGGDDNDVDAMSVLLERVESAKKASQGLKEEGDIFNRVAEANNLTREFENLLVGRKFGTKTGTRAKEVEGVRFDNYFGDVSIVIDGEERRLNLDILRELLNNSEYSAFVEAARRKGMIRNGELYFGGQPQPQTQTQIQEPQKETDVPPKTGAEIE